MGVSWGMKNLNNIKSVFPVEHVHDSYQQVKKDARDFSVMLAHLGATETTFRRNLSVYQRGENVHPLSYVPVPEYDVTILGYLKDIIKSRMNLTLASLSPPWYGLIEQVRLRVTDITLENDCYVFHTHVVSPSALIGGRFSIPISCVGALLSEQGYHLEVDNFHYDLRLYFQAYSDKLPYSLDKDVEELEVMYRFMYAKHDLYFPMLFSPVNDRAFLAPLPYSRIWEHTIYKNDSGKINMEEGLLAIIAQLRSSSLYMSLWDEGVRRFIHYGVIAGENDLVLYTTSVTDRSEKTYNISDIGYVGSSSYGFQAVLTTVEGISFKIWVSNQFNPEWTGINAHDVIETLDVLNVPFSIYFWGYRMLVVSDTVPTKLVSDIQKADEVHLLSYDEYNSPEWSTKDHIRLFYHKNVVN